MQVRHLISPLVVGVLASVAVAHAQPAKKGDPKAKQADKKKKGPVAPAKDAPEPAKDAAKDAAGKDATPAKAGAPAKAGGGDGAPATGGTGGVGTTVEMTEDTPPSDIEGRDENPDAPRAVGMEPAVVVIAPVKKVRREGYPIEEALRPINLPENMSEVSLGPHAQLSPYAGADALRARYGITSKIQLGLTYLFAGIFDDPATLEDKLGLHGGKAVGLDVTVLLRDWVGVRVGVPVYINPVAVSLQLGAPLKFVFRDKYAIGGFDDLLNIKLKRFPPSFYQEQINAVFAVDDMVNSVESKGSLRFSAFGVYQRQPKLAIIGKLGINVDDFSTRKTDAGGGLTTFIRAGFNYTPRKYLDVGFSLGFDDLAKGGSFGPAGLLNVRI